MHKELTCEKLRVLADIPKGTVCHVVGIQAVFSAEVHGVQQNNAYGTTRVMFGNIHLESGKLNTSEEGHVVLCLTKHNSQVSVQEGIVKYRCGVPKEEIDFILPEGR